MKNLKIMKIWLLIMGMHNGKLLIISINIQKNVLIDNFWNQNQSFA